MGNGDANDIWQLWIDGAAKGEPLQPIRHRFRLIHYLQRCALSTTTLVLPDWYLKEGEKQLKENSLIHTQHSLIALAIVDLNR